MLIFAYRHHVYELVIKSVFDVKFSQETTSPDSPLFKKFRNNWKSTLIKYSGIEKSLQHAARLFPKLTVLPI